jgi:hypothetical protein
MNLTLLVKTLDSGQVAAAVLELPVYRVEAERDALGDEEIDSAIYSDWSNDL